MQIYHTHNSIPGQSEIVNLSKKFYGLIYVLHFFVWLLRM